MESGAGLGKAAGRTGLSVVVEGAPASVVQECRDLSLTPALSSSATVISVYHFLLGVQAPSP